MAKHPMEVLTVPEGYILVMLYDEPTQAHAARNFVFVRETHDTIHDFVRKTYGLRSGDRRWVWGEGGSEVELGYIMGFGHRGRDYGAKDDT